MAEAPILHEDSTDDEDFDDEDDIDEPECVTFVDLCRRAVSKPLQRGQLFLSNGRVGAVLDTCRQGLHFIKSQVHASMKNVA